MNVSLFISIISATLSFGAITVTYLIFRRQQDTQSYANIDQMYFEILRLAIEHPQLRNREETARYYELPPSDRVRYENYAFICWNLCETIFDRQAVHGKNVRLSETWFPVILEENQLHQSWFNHNLGKFKKSFQDYIRYTINALDISDLDPGNQSELDEMLNVYGATFPENERIPRDHLLRLIKNKIYRVLVARHRSFKELIGFALVAEFTEPSFSHLDYMAIDPKYQRSGYGTVLFQTVAENLSLNSIGLLLEVEDPALADNPSEERTRENRIVFYDRLGCHPLGIDYLFPHDPPTPMRLMFRPKPSVKLLPANDLAKMIHSVFAALHGDVLDLKSIYDKIAATISDQPFNGNHVAKRESSR